MFLSHAALEGAAMLLAQTAHVGATVRDTVVTIPGPSDPGWFERLGETLRALMTLAILVLTVAVVPAAWNFRKSYQKVSDLLDKVYADVNPITHHASRIAENVDYVSTALRADVQRASALLTSAERRLEETLRRAEARARDLEALIEVAQSEAEHSLVTAASAVAGVREGVASLRDDLADAWTGRGGAAYAPARAPGAASVPAEWDAAREAAMASDLLAGDEMIDDLALVDARLPVAPDAPVVAPHERARSDPEFDERPRVRTRRRG